jgi:RimJ/RimL family protein N-acetyltransferase
LIFRNAKVVLRAFEPEDAPALHAYLSRPELVGRRYLPWKFPDLAPLAHKQAEEIYAHWIGQEKALNLAVTDAVTSDLIGHAYADWGWDPHAPDLAVVIDPPFQRLGYGSAALALLLQYLFEHTPAHNLSAWIADWNQPALDFAARHGFQAAGRLRWAGLRQGQPFDFVILDLLRPEWAAAQAGR